MHKGTSNVRIIPPAESFEVEGQGEAEIEEEFLKEITIEKLLPKS